MRGHDTQRGRKLGSSAVGIVLGGAAFYLTLFNFTTDLGRTALAIPYTSNFFDLQARALMAGHLHLPPKSLGIEGFVHDGQTYTYFGPFPALIRIPVKYLTSGFDSRLTLVSMGLAFAVYALSVVRLTWLVRSVIRPGVAVGRVEACLAALFLAAATGGSVLTFDGSLPWVYHEVYLWQTALTVAAAYWMVRMGLHPSVRAAVWLAFLGICTILTRTPGGLGTCIGIALLGVLMIALPRWRAHRRLGGLTVGAAVMAVAIGVLVNEAKFGTPFLFPLQDQVWTQVNAHRRLALRANGGSLTGPQFFLTALINYFRPDGVRLVGYFPWITLPAHNARAYGGAVIDQSYRTGSVTCFMPLLLLLSLCGPVVWLRRATRRPGIVLVAPAVGMFAITAGVMSYGYIAYRYTSDFLPALVMLGLLGLWGVLVPATGALTRLARPLAAVPIGLVAVLTAFAIAANMAVGFATAATTYQGWELQRYVSLQDRFSGGPGSAFARLIHRTTALPTGGSTDDIAVAGDCDTVYLNTGDDTNPWELVEGRPRVVRIDLADRTRPGQILLWQVVGVHDRTVALEVASGRLVRVVLHNEGGNYDGPWVAPAPGEQITVGVGYDTEYNQVEITSSPGGFVGYLPIEEYDAAWVRHPGRVIDEVTRPTDRLDIGVRIAPAPGTTPSLCERIVRTNGVGAAAR